MSAEAPSPGQRRPLTWTAAGLLVLLAVIFGSAAGVGLAAGRVYLAPPLAANTLWFYAALPALPALAVFAWGVSRRRGGRRAGFAAASLLAGLAAGFYLVVIAPLFYADIQCRPEPRQGLAVGLACECRSEGSDLPPVQACRAQAWPPLPIIRLLPAE